MRSGRRKEYSTSQALVIGLLGSVDSVLVYSRALGTSVESHTHLFDFVDDRIF